MDRPIRRVVLIGFMASGKTTVGRLLADRLGWRHVDLDAVVEQEQGKTVREIFELEGEAAFRRMEAEASDRLISLSETVLTPGGGWVANPGVTIRRPPGTLTVWLRVSAEEVVRRVRVGGGPARPLLAAGDPDASVRALLAEREPLYREADLALQTTGNPPADLAAEIDRIVRSHR